MTTDNRYVIGFLNSGINDNFSIDLGEGLIQRANEEDVSVVFLSGKFIDRDLPEEIKYEYQYNLMYELVKKDNIDAIIIAADAI